MATTKKMTLLALADNANDDGCCWPSLQTIANKVCVSRRHIIRIIGELETDGYLSRHKRMIEGEKGIYQSSSLYQLNIAKLSPPSDTHVTGVVTPMSPPSDTHVTGVVTPMSPPSDTHVTGVVTPMSPRTINEPSVNHQLIDKEASVEAEADSLSILYPKTPSTATPYPNDETDALSFIAEITGNMTIPSSRDIPRDAVVEKINAIIAKHGIEEGKRRARAAFAEWGKRRRADGRHYSKLNPGWLDWALADEIPEPLGTNGGGAKLKLKGYTEA